MDGYVLKTVTTLPNATVVEYSNSLVGEQARQSPGYKGPRDLIFSDQNNNQKLDENDLVLSVYVAVEGFPLPEKTSCSSGIEGAGVCVTQVTADQVERYGPELNALFTHARELRGQMPELIGSRDQGYCGKFIKERRHVSDIAVSFVPPLSTTISPDPEITRYRDRHNLPYDEKLNPWNEFVRDTSYDDSKPHLRPQIDPRKCPTASSTFETSFEDAEVSVTVELGDEEIIDSSFFGALKYFGLENKPEYVDVGYYQSTEGWRPPSDMHIDLNAR